MKNKKNVKRMKQMKENFKSHGINVRGQGSGVRVQG